MERYVIVGHDFLKIQEQKIRKNISELNNNISQLDFIGAEYFRHQENSHLLSLHRTYSLRQIIFSVIKDIAVLSHKTKKKVIAINTIEINYAYKPWDGLK